MTQSEPVPFKLLRPARSLGGVIIASPHSGRDYPAAFLARSCLDPMRLRSSEDAFVDQLLAQMPSLGAPLLLALVPRAYVDFNRGAQELDPALIEGLRAGPINARVRSGLGVIARVVAGGQAIYRGKLSLAEAEARIAQYWTPWQAQVTALMAEAQAEHGQAILLDLHSMPSEALEARPRRPEIVLGDRFGASAAPEVTRSVEAAFLAEGFRVARNVPFAGAYTAEAHGRPAHGRHVVQIEIDRSLYLDEARIEPSAGFAQMQERLTRALKRVIDAQSETRLAAQ